MATERLILELRVQGTRQVTQNLKRVRKEARSANKTLALLRSTLVVVAGARVIGQFLELADSLTNIRNRLRLVTTATAQLNAVQARLFSISQDTRSSFETNALLFNRLARSTDGLKLSFNDLLDITKGITQALAISGATSQEARNALIQFSQGLAAGAVRGDELRSVVEQLPRLADAIAKEFSISADSTARSLGVTEEALRSVQKETSQLAGGALIAFAKANEGALTTARVIKALQADLGNLDAEFSKIDITVGQAFTKFRNQLTLFIGGLSKSINLGANLDKVLTVIARNLDIIAVSLAALLIIGAFNLLTSQALKFGVVLRGIASFLATGFLSVFRLLGFAFAPLLAGVRLAGVAAVGLSKSYILAVKVISAHLFFLRARFELLSARIIKSFGAAMTFMRVASIATATAVFKAFQLIPLAIFAMVRATRISIVSFVVLTSVVGRLRGALIVLGTAGSKALLLLGGAVRNIIPLLLRMVVVLAVGFLPAIVVIAAVVAGFFALRALVQVVEKRFGSLGKTFQKVIGAIFGLLDGLVESFSLLDDAIGDIAVQAGNALIAGFEAGVNGAIDLLNILPGINITPADLGRIENQFEGAFAKVKDILTRNISDGINGGFKSTDTFKALANIGDQIKKLFLGGLLPDDFGEAKLKALLDQISGTRDGLSNFDTAAKKAASSIRSIRASVDPAEAAFKKLNDALEAFSKISKKSAVFTAFARETLILLAQDLVNVKDAEFAYGRQLDLVNKLVKENLLTTEQAALARKQFALEAQQDFANTLGAVFPLIAAERELAEVEVFLLKNRNLLAKAGIDAAEAQVRLTRETLGFGNTSKQVSEQLQVLSKAFRDGAISADELAVATNKVNLGFLEQQRDPASGAERFFVKLTDAATDSATQIEEVLGAAFKGVEDSLVKFVQTGKIEIGELADVIQEQLLRQAIQGIISAVGNLAISAFGGTTGAAGGQAGGAIGQVFGNIIPSLFGAQNGAQFTVGPSTSVANLSGADNRLVAFRAQDREEVTVAPRDGSGGGGGARPINVEINVQAAGDSAEDTGQAVGQAVASAAEAIRRFDTRNN